MAILQNKSWVQDEIKAKAEKIWKLRGRPVEQDVQIWLEAEKEVVCYYWKVARKNVLSRKEQRRKEKKILYFLSFRWFKKLIIDYLEE